MNELIKVGESITIKDNDIKVVEYKGFRVLSSYDIAKLHGKEVRTVNQQFERNKNRLQEGVDYFLISREEFAITDSDHKISNKARHQFERLFTEKGYLKLIKSFTDDLSWEIQDLLVDSYFKLQAITPKQSFLLGILSATDELSRAVAINKYEVGYVQPLEYKVAEQAQTIEANKPKVTYHDIVLKCPNLVSVSEIVKDFGISAVKLNKILARNKVQYRDRYGKWSAYQEYKTEGLAATETKVISESGVSFAKQHLKWTQKGRMFIYEMLKTEGVLPICEQSDQYQRSFYHVISNKP